MPRRAAAGLGRRPARTGGQHRPEAGLRRWPISALPDGYDTILSPEFASGRDLSIGQWQRVALARAFIRDAPLVILDEPSAALDPWAEHALFASIRTLYAERTVLRGADRIYVLHDGQIIEHGSHDDLMLRDGVYAELFTLQAAAYTLPVP